MSGKKRPLGVQIARKIIQGDVDAAHKLRGTRTSWTVPEVRALEAATKFSNRWYGSKLSLKDFMAVAPRGAR